MRTDLIGFLARHPIVHPTWVERIVICASQIDMTIGGYPWWKPKADEETPSTVTFAFQGVSKGALAVPLDEDDGCNEDLDDFSITSLAYVDWAQPASHAVYCQGPLSDSARIYGALQSFLSRADAFLGPGDFLNAGNLLADFIELTSRPDYLLARVPKVLSDLLIRELDLQAVPHNVLQDDTRPETRLRVSLNGSSFLCEKAWVEIADSA